MAQTGSRRWLVAGAALVLLVAGAIGWWRYVPSPTLVQFVSDWWTSFRGPTLVGFVSGNGRLEAQEINIATKFQGRIAEVLADEGDVVKTGQIVARMDTKSLEAQLREAEAKVKQAETRRSAARAFIAQRHSEEVLAKRDLERASALYERNDISLKEFDRARTALQTTKAQTEAAEAQLAEAEAAIDAAKAETQRLRADIEDSVLTAPRSGRVLYRVAEPGEVLSGGGKVLTIIDLDDMYMTLFLSSQEAGKVRIGADARLVFDALPQQPVLAQVSFVADKAQFTPKEVETATERQKLTFRIKAQVRNGNDPLLKPGMPGVAYIRVDDTAPWPKHLQ